MTNPVLGSMKSDSKSNQRISPRSVNKSDRSKVRSGGSDSMEFIRLKSKSQIIKRAEWAIKTKRKPHYSKFRPS
jgi:hypothetical protein